MGLFSLRLPQQELLTTQLSLHLSRSEWLWHVHCQHTSTDISTYLKKNRRVDIKSAVGNNVLFCRCFGQEGSQYNTPATWDWIKSWFLWVPRGYELAPSQTSAPQSPQSPSGSSCSVSGVRWSYPGPTKRTPLFVKAPVIVTPHLLPQGEMGQEGF